MSGEEYFCDYCGHNSRSRERCTECGRYISDLYDSPPGFSLPVWGRMTLRLHDRTGSAQVWKELAGFWRERVEETHPHRPSQMEQFNTDADSVALYGADYMVSLMREALGSRGRVDFEELPHEQIPRWPKHQPRRPPTVPRNKR